MTAEDLKRALERLDISEATADAIDEVVRSRADQPARMPALPGEQDSDQEDSLPENIPGS